MPDPSRYPAYRQSGIEWSPEVPDHWDVVPLKASIEGCVNGIWGDSPQGDETDLVCVRVADFDRQRFLVSTADLTIRSVPSGARRSRLLEVGDLLLEKSGGGEKQPVGAVVRVDEGVPLPAVCSNFMARMPVAERYESRFLAYLHATLYSTGVNGRSIKQSTGIQNLDAGSYLAERIPGPPLDEQQAVADFLDRETVKIDALIDQKQHLIDLLQERRVALITQAVTKGLDSEVEMTDSGVDELGAIPCRWRVVRLKFLSKFVTSGSRGWAQYYSDDGALFLRIGNLMSDAIDLNLADCQLVDPPSGSEAERSRARPGDLLVSITALIGGVGVAPPDLGEAYINQHIALVRLLPAAVNPRWPAYFLLSRAGQIQFQRGLYGGTKAGLSLDEVRELLIVVPPEDAQDRILAFLDARMTALDALGSQIRTAIDLLREYRTALISAAVTGKIDVRESAA